MSGGVKTWLMTKAFPTAINTVSTIYKIKTQLLAVATPQGAVICIKCVCFVSDWNCTKDLTTGYT